MRNSNTYQHDTRTLSAQLSVGRCGLLTFAGAFRMSSCALCEVYVASKAFASILVAPVTCPVLSRGMEEGSQTHTRLYHCVRKRFKGVLLCYSLFRKSSFLCTTSKSYSHESQPDITV